MGSGKPPKREESQHGAAAGVDWAPLEADPSASAITVDGAEEDEGLRRSAVLSREEVLRRRSRRVRQLAQLYRRQYWALMEDVRVKHRDYYWDFGVSPFEEEDDDDDDDGHGGKRRRIKAEDEGEAAPVLGGSEGGEDSRKVGGGVGLGFGEREETFGKKKERKRCEYNCCKGKAMPFTRYCHTHILYDRKQTLYKACSHVMKRGGQGGQTTCPKPVLRSVVPSLCNQHFQKAQKNFSYALRKAGLNVSFASKIPKFSVLIAEYVQQIQARRREAFSGFTDDINQKDQKET